MLDPATCLAHAPVDGANQTAVPDLWVYRRDRPATENTVYGCGIILVAQGRKQARMGEEVFVYDRDHYLVTAVPLPVVSEILIASPERPFLSLFVSFGLEDVREIVARAGSALPPIAPAPPQRGLAACPMTGAVMAVAHRLLGLLEQPEDIAVLAPMLRCELLYYVLKGPQGGLLRALAMGHSQQRAVADVLTAIHADCSRTFTVAELAAMAAMSESVFFEAFKAVTATTPLQYIKRLRLQEAHRLITWGATNVSGAAQRVGYNSLPQFSREFTRLFGANPSELLP